MNSSRFWDFTRLSGLLSLFVLLIFNPLQAQTIVNGFVNGHWDTDGSPYIANGTITVQAADSLQIDPGVEVLFSPNTGFNVYGTLLAIGTLEDSIIFRSNRSVIGDWSSLHIDGAGSNATRIAFSIIQHCDNGLYLTDCRPVISNSRISDHSRACIRAENSQAEILGCNIANSQRTGIVLDERSNMRIRSGSVSGFQSNGIAITGLSTAIIEGMEITGGSDHGIYLSQAGVCSLAYNRIYASGVHGIFLSQSDRVVIYRNVVYRANGSYAVHLYRSDNFSLINNTILDNSVSGLGAVNSTGEVLDNIIGMNGQDGIFVQGGGVTLGFNDVWQNRRDDYSGIAADNTDISEDPLLTAPGQHDFRPQEGSPVINAGSPRFRDPDGTVADIGADFYNLNDPPVIESYYPEELDVVGIDAEIVFGVQASDPNGHPIVYEWYLNGSLISREATATINFDRLGTAVVSVFVDDRLYLGRVSHTWQFAVPVREDGALPTEFSVKGPYPNPFNSSSRITLTLPVEERVSVQVVDLSGRMVSMIADEQLAAGSHQMQINAQNLQTGTYFLIVKRENSRFAEKFIVLK